MAIEREDLLVDERLEKAEILVQSVQIRQRLHERDGNHEEEGHQEQEDAYEHAPGVELHVRDGNVVPAHVPGFGSPLGEPARRVLALLSLCANRGSPACVERHEPRFHHILVVACQDIDPLLFDLRESTRYARGC